MDCSIVIPYKDRIDLLRHTLHGLCLQDTKRPFEVIVVDDGSEVPPEWSFAQSNLPVKTEFIHQNNRGSAAARNAGWLAAKGKIVIFLDCDQIVEPTFVEQHCRAFEVVDRPFLQLGTRRNLLPESAVNPKDMSDASFLRDERMRFFMHSSLNLGNIEIAWHLCFSHNISVHKENLIRFGGFDTGFKGWGFEDCEIGYRFKQFGIPLALNPMISTFHQNHNQFMSKDKFQKWKANLDYFLDKYSDPDLHVQKALIGSTDPTRHDAHKWDTSLKQMENLLRLAKNRPLPAPFVETQKFENTKALRLLVGSGEAETTRAIVSRADTETIISTQLDPDFQEIRLFFA